MRLFKNHTCNRFLLSEPKCVTKNWHIYTDLLPGPLLKQKYFVALTLQKSFFLSIELNFVYIKNCSTLVSARIVVSIWEIFPSS